MSERTLAVQGKTSAPSGPGRSGVLQRQCACGTHTGGGECEACSQKRALQRRTVPGSAEPSLAPAIVHDVLAAPGLPLDNPTRAFMEPRFGRDFSGVRVHNDARAAESARSVNALAYTVGQDLVFAQGRYAPHTPPGMRLLAHELAHSVQQGSAGAVPQAKLEIGSAGSPLEAAADRAADAVLRGGSLPALGGTGRMLSRQVAETRSLPEERGECRPNPVLGADVTHYTLPTADAPTGKYTISSVESVRTTRSGSASAAGRATWCGATPGPPPRKCLPPPAGAPRHEPATGVAGCGALPRRHQGYDPRGRQCSDQVIQLVLNTITSGGDAAAAWNKASITPNVSGSLKVGQWSVDLSAHTTVSSQGKDTGAGGEVSVSTDVGGGRATGGVSVDSQKVGQGPVGRRQGAGFLPLRVGQDPEAAQVHQAAGPSGFTYECREERDVSKPGTQAVTQADERVYNLFFHYAVPTFDEPRNRKSWIDLTADLATGGYQVSRIEGWASPEGPMGMGTGGFKGNKDLRSAAPTRSRPGSPNCVKAGAVSRPARRSSAWASGSTRPTSRARRRTFPASRWRNM